MPNSFDIEEIRKVLPHSYPFLFIDRVVDMEVGKWIKAYKNVTYNEPFFQGHFQKKAVMPGALIMEACAQAGAFALLKEDENKDKIVFLAGVDNFKFRGMVSPGDRLDIQVDIENRRAHYGVAKAQAKVGENTVASGEIKFFIE